MAQDVFEMAGDLSRKGEPYVLATVVWRRGPSSGKEGYRALITAEGKVHGWISGACAEPVVVRQSLQALADGTPRLLYLGPPDELESRARDGLMSSPSFCASEGALEVYVDPVISKPHLVVVGGSPAVQTLVSMAKALGWRTVVVDEEAPHREHTAADQVIPALDLEAAGVTSRSLVVVATQGHYDEEALEKALATEAAYIGLVASRKRAKAVLEVVREQGVGEDVLSRVHAPAGLDLGHVSHEEIAVAVLAELVQLKASGKLAAGTAAAPSSTEKAMDPVCGMTVEVAKARHTATHQGQTFYFCCPACRKSFEAEPAKYVAVGA